MIFNYFNLKSDLDDYDRIHSTIHNGIVFKGTNLWILVFAIIIASVGLNMNSTAVIIGAMLISPLMGPINGMGYSIATYDFPLFRRSFKNFSFAVVSSLLASTLYFTISPLSTAHSELLARTSPTIYDVLIALFGGLAGIVAISSKHKGNIVPGVAIATALMPPLCTAGFGLATGQFTYFFGAFYLFTINTVFIGISSVLISQILNFPIRTIIEPAQRRRVNHLITLVIVITIIPSIYFGYLMIQKERFMENVKKFTSKISVYEGSYLLKHEADFGKRTIHLVYGGSLLDQNHKNKIEEISTDFSLKEAKLVISQGFSFKDKIEDEIDKRDDQFKAEINRLTFLLQQKELEKDSITKSIALGRQLLREIKPIYPSIVACAYNEMTEFTDNNTSRKIPTIIFTTNRSSLRIPEKEKIREWIKRRLNLPEVKIYYEK